MSNNGKIYYRKKTNICLFFNVYLVFIAFKYDFCYF